MFFAMLLLFSKVYQIFTNTVAGLSLVILMFDFSDLGIQKQELYEMTENILSNSTIDAIAISCSSTTGLLDIFCTCFLAMVIILNVSGNSCVFMLVARSRMLRKLPSNVFLASLALADILIGIFILPIKVKQSVHNQLFCMSRETCWFYFLIDTFLSVCSITLLLVIAIDQFFAIRFPYKYQLFMNKRKMYTVLAGTWIYSFLWCILFSFNWGNPKETGLKYSKQESFCIENKKHYFVSVYLIIFFMPMMIIVVTYSYIYFIALRHIRVVAANEVNSGDSKKNYKRR